MKNLVLAIFGMTGWGLFILLWPTFSEHSKEGALGVLFGSLTVLVIYYGTLLYNRIKK